MNTSQATSIHSDLHRGTPARIAAGVAVIAIGLVFLAQNLGWDVPLFAWNNWWALLIVIGAIGPLDRAWQRYRAVGSVDSQVLHALLNALAVLTVAAIFLFDLSFARWWPLFLIIGGLSMMTKEGPRASDRDRGAN